MSGRRHPSGLWRDRSGNVSIVAAISMTMLIAVAALVIDMGSLYYARRNQQAATDAAALAAVQNPSNATTVAASVLDTNGYSSPTIVVTTGTYVADESLTVSQRFTPSSTGINAVRVRTTVQRPANFSTFFGLGPDVTLVTQATAARLPTVSFGAGTALIRLNAGVLNSVLSKFWGSNLSLSLVDYQALASTNVQLVPFLNQLASNLSISGSYTQLAGTSVTAGQMMTALAQTTNTYGEGNTGTSLLALQQLQTEVSSNATVPMSSVVDFTPLEGRTIGGVIPDSNPSLSVNAMSLLTADARTVAAGNIANLGTTLTIPVANATMTTRLAVGSPMAQAIDATVGTTVQTAQIRAAIVLSKPSVNLVAATATVQVPIYMQMATGAATLTAMPCSPSGDIVDISASSGLTSLQFGTVSDANLQNFSAPVTPVAAPVVSVTLLGIPITVSIAGSASVAASGPQTLSFTQADIDNGTVQTVPSGSAAPFTALSGTFTLSPSVAGNPLLSASLSSLLSALNPVVTGLIAPVDTTMSEALASLGLALGATDVRVFDASCRVPTIVG